MQTPVANLYEFGEFQLDTGKRLLRRLDGTPVPLTSRVFDTLLYMVRHHDAVLDKERIMEAVWPDSIVEENNLAQAISKLRQVFGETPGSHSYIVTVPGRGYRFVAEVNERPTTAVTAESQIAESQFHRCSRHGCHYRSRRFSDSPHSPFPTLERRLPAKTGWFWVAARSWRWPSLASHLFVVRHRAPNSRALAAGTAYICHRSPEKASPFCRSTISATKNKTPISPLACRMKLLSNLARIADLKVISRTSANLYKSGNPRNSREIGQQLGVAHLLEGNVQRIGNRLRVNAQLINARHRRTCLGANL